MPAEATTVDVDEAGDVAGQLLLGVDPLLAHAEADAGQAQLQHRSCSSGVMRCLIQAKRRPLSQPPLQVGCVDTWQDRRQLARRRGLVGQQRRVGVDAGHAHVGRQDQAVAVDDFRPLAVFGGISARGSIAPLAATACGDCSPSRCQSTMSIRRRPMLQKAMAKLAATTRSRRRPLASDSSGSAPGWRTGHQSRPSPRPAMTGNGFERSSTPAPDGSIAWTGTRAHCSSSQPGIWAGRQQSGRRERRPCPAAPPA